MKKYNPAAYDNLCRQIKNNAQARAANYLALAKKFKRENGSIKAILMAMKGYHSNMQDC